MVRRVVPRVLSVRLALALLELKRQTRHRTQQANARPQCKGCRGFAIAGVRSFLPAAAHRARAELRFVRDHAGRQTDSSLGSRVARDSRPRRVETRGAHQRRTCSMREPLHVNGANSVNAANRECVSELLRRKNGPVSAHTGPASSWFSSHDSEGRPASSGHSWDRNVLWCKLFAAEPARAFAHSGRIGGA